MICPHHSNKCALEEVTSDILVARSSGYFLVFIYWTFAASATVPPHILLELLCPYLDSCDAQASGFLVLFGVSFMVSPSLICRFKKLAFSPGFWLDSLLAHLSHLGELIIYFAWFQPSLSGQSLQGNTPSSEHFAEFHTHF